MTTPLALPSQVGDQTPYLRATLLLLDGAPKVVSTPQRAALLALAALYEHDLRTGSGADWIAAPRIARVLGVTEATAGRHLRNLADMRLVRRHYVGQGVGGYVEYAPRTLEEVTA